MTSLSTSWMLDLYSEKYKKIWQESLVDNNYVHEFDWKIENADISKVVNDVVFWIDFTLSNSHIKMQKVLEEMKIYIESQKRDIKKDAIMVDYFNYLCETFCIEPYLTTKKLPNH